jgi:riboflavin biosynthesis pyrimidine reductase
MDRGTTFYFVTEGFDAAYAQAVATAGDRAVLIAGGAAAVRQVFAAGVIDERVLHIEPMLLGEDGGAISGRRGSRTGAGRRDPLPEGDVYHLSVGR